MQEASESSRGEGVSGEKRGLRRFCALLLLFVLVALAAYCWRGWYTRYITDDFCTAAALEKRGFIGAMAYHRRTWSGRYSYYAAKAIPEAIGPSTARYVPGLTIALWCAASFWTMRRLARSRSRVFLLLAGLAVVFATIDGTPDVLAVGGPVVWETGVVTYMLPLLLYTLWAGLFFGGGSILMRSIASALLMLAAGGLSETSLAGQGPMTFGVLLLVLLLRRKDLVRVAAAGFAASLLALLLMGTAPGNSVRMMRLDPQTPLPQAVLDSFALAYHYVGSVAFSDGAALFLIVFCGWIVGRTSAPFPMRAALLTAAVAIGAFTATFLPSAWMLGMGPPPRALHVTVFFFTVAIFALSAALGSLGLRSMRFALPLLGALSLMAAIHSTKVTIDTIDYGRKSAAEMDRIEAILRSHPRQNVVIESDLTITNRILTAEPEFWTNRCISDFYGVRTVTVTR